MRCSLDSASRTTSSNSRQHGLRATIGGGRLSGAAGCPGEGGPRGSGGDDHGGGTTTTTDDTSTTPNAPATTIEDGSDGKGDAAGRSDEATAAVSNPSGIWFADPRRRGEAETVADFEVTVVCSSTSEGGYCEDQHVADPPPGSVRR